MTWIVAILAAYGMLITWMYAYLNMRWWGNQKLIMRLESQVRRRDEVMKELELLLSELKEDENDDLVRTSKQRSTCCGSGHSGADTGFRRQAN